MYVYKRKTIMRCVFVLNLICWFFWFSLLPLTLFKPTSYVLHIVDPDLRTGQIRVTEVLTLNKLRAKANRQANIRLVKVSQSLVIYI